MAPATRTLSAEDRARYEPVLKAFLARAAFTYVTTQDMQRVLLPESEAARDPPTRPALPGAIPAASIVPAPVPAASNPPAPVPATLILPAPVQNQPWNDYLAEVTTIVPTYNRKVYAHHVDLRHSECGGNSTGSGRNRRLFKGTHGLQTYLRQVHGKMLWVKWMMETCVHRQVGAIEVQVVVNRTRQAPEIQACVTKAGADAAVA